MTWMWTSNNFKYFALNSNDISNLPGCVACYWTPHITSVHKYNVTPTSNMFLLSVLWRVIFSVCWLMMVTALNEDYLLNISLFSLCWLMKVAALNEDYLLHMSLFFLCWLMMVTALNEDYLLHMSLFFLCWLMMVTALNEDYLLKHVTIFPVLFTLPYLQASLLWT